MAKLTAQQVAELRANATPPPWRCHAVLASVYAEKQLIADAGLTREQGKTLANAQFLSAAHDMADLIAEQASEIERLNTAIRVQANAVRNLQSAERTLAAHDRKVAERARAESRPDAIESERAANAQLTAEIDQQAARIKELEADAARWAEVHDKAWFVDAVSFAYGLRRQFDPTIDADEAVAAIDAARAKEAQG